MNSGTSQDADVLQVAVIVVLGYVGNSDFRLTWCNEGAPETIQRIMASTRVIGKENAGAGERKISS